MKKRFEGTQVIRPLVYGNTAEFLVDEFEKRRSGNIVEKGLPFTHRWVLFLRSANPNEDLSVYVEKVVFYLHPTYPNPKREILQPPYEIEERGYGSFTVDIYVHIRGRKRPIYFRHHLNLNHNSSGEKMMDALTQNVIYDNIVFNNPSPQLQELLRKAIVSDGGADNVPVRLAYTEKDESETKLEMKRQYLMNTKVVREVVKQKSEAMEAEILKLLEKIKEVAVIAKELQKDIKVTPKRSINRPRRKSKISNTNESSEEISTSSSDDEDSTELYDDGVD